MQRIRAEGGDDPCDTGAGFRALIEDSATAPIAAKRLSRRWSRISDGRSGKRRDGRPQNGFCPRRLLMPLGRPISTKTTRRTLRCRVSICAGGLGGARSDTAFNQAGRQPPQGAKTRLRHISQSPNGQRFADRQQRFGDRSPFVIDATLLGRPRSARPSLRPRPCRDLCRGKTLSWLSGTLHENTGVAPLDADLSRFGEYLRHQAPHDAVRSLISGSAMRFRVFTKRFKPLPPNRWVRPHGPMTTRVWTGPIGPNLPAAKLPPATALAAHQGSASPPQKMPLNRADGRADANAKQRQDHHAGKKPLQIIERARR